MKYRKVKTVKPHNYGNRSYDIGEEYDMEERFVTVMETMGNVRALEAEPAIERQPADPSRYKRRDMRPQK